MKGLRKRRVDLWGMHCSRSKATYFPPLLVEKDVHDFVSLKESPSKFGDEFKERKVFIYPVGCLLNYMACRMAFYY